MSSSGGVDDSTSSPMAADVPSSSLASNEATGSVPQYQNTMNSNDASYSTTATEQNNTPGKLLLTAFFSFVFLLEVIYA